MTDLEHAKTIELALANEELRKGMAICSQIIKQLRTENDVKQFIINRYLELYVRRN